MPRRRPIVTLTTDFGHTDFYVAAMKGVLLHHCPEAVLIDVTHDIRPQDIVAGSITLERALNSFQPGTVHLAVVDPGVGTNRGLLVVRFKNGTIVCPDNGLITWSCRLHSVATIREITWRPRECSNTFHGRDILAPIAGMIAAGLPIVRGSRAISNPRLLDLAPAIASNQGRVIHIDHFGNATTNIPANFLDGLSKKSVHIGRYNIGVLRSTYADVSIGEPLALIGSSGLLEIAIRNGSAAKKFRIKVGDKVFLK